MSESLTGFPLNGFQEVLSKGFSDRNQPGPDLHLIPVDSLCIGRSDHRTRMHANAQLAGPNAPRYSTLHQMFLLTKNGSLDRRGYGDITRCQ